MYQNFRHKRILILGQSSGTKNILNPIFFSCHFYSLGTKMYQNFRQGRIPILSKSSETKNILNPQLIHASRHNFI